MRNLLLLSGVRPALNRLRRSVWLRLEVGTTHDVQAGSRTIMHIEHRTLNNGLRETFFTELELRRGG